MYGIVTSVRNILYDLGWFKRQKALVPTLVVGNLKVGGTGKTPFVEWLVQYFLEQHMKVCVLSRGYGRATMGFFEAQPFSTASMIGDEPLQYYSKYAEKGLRVFVGEDRVAAIKQIQHCYPEVSLVLLDDAFQHRSLEADHSILLTEFDKPFFKDYLLPFGWLREARTNAKRADIIVVTKSPVHFDNQKMRIKTRLEPYLRYSTPIFFQQIRYQPLLPLFNKPVPNRVDKVVLLCGIANSSPFETYCRSKFTVLKLFSFPDHYTYKLSDIREVIAFSSSLGQAVSIITTEKDAMRLHGFESELSDFEIAFLPITTEFVEGREDFERQLMAWYPCRS